jgi:hypothetical protein
MKPAIKRLSEKLTTTADGGAACDAINALTKHATKGGEDAKTTLAEYMVSGQVDLHIHTSMSSKMRLGG